MKNVDKQEIKDFKKKAGYNDEAAKNEKFLQLQKMANVRKKILTIE